MGKFIIALCLCLAGALAQAPIGAIAGTVLDESGAAVPGAEIVIRNLDTGLERKLLSNEDGLYAAPALPAGRYEVRAQKAGFRQLVRPAQVLTGSTTTVEMNLAVGAVTEVVSVSDTASQLNYESHKIDGVIKREQIENLP